jgi:cyclopropane-fatty-acyl-phospholipid synthase
MSETPITTPPRAGASPDAIMAHYDISDAFFGLWIGPEMIYSSALFEHGDDLHGAQLRKLDYHIAAAGAAATARVLDIGCGWGALLRRLVQHADVKTACGLTLSRSQAAWIRRSAPPGVEVREEDWRVHQADMPYDAIISIGAFEHFAHRGLDRQAKLDVYRSFFDFCHRVLADDGRLSLQTIAYVKSSTDVPSLITDKIFPDSELPLISEPIVAAEEKFELLTLRNDADHYYRTLRMWDANLAGRHDEAVALVGEQTVSDFRQYLRTSAFGFRRGHICLLRMSFRKCGA